jgi:hypothetical protein
LLRKPRHRKICIFNECLWIASAGELKPALAGRFLRQADSAFLLHSHRTRRQLNELVVAFRTGSDADPTIRRVPAPVVTPHQRSAALIPAGGPGLLQQLAEQAFTAAPRKAANADKHHAAGWAEF